MPESTDITAEFNNTLAPPMLTTRHTLLHRLLIAGSALLALAWMGLIIFSGPRILTGENHTGYDIRYLWCLSSISAPIALAGLLSGQARNRRPAILLATLAISLAAAVFWLDRSNLIIHYETWITRGMPTAP